MLGIRNHVHTAPNKDVPEFVPPKPRPTKPKQPPEDYLENLYSFEVKRFDNIFGVLTVKAKDFNTAYNLIVNSGYIVVGQVETKNTEIYR